MIQNFEISFTFCFSIKLYGNVTWELLHYWFRIKDGTNRVVHVRSRRDRLKQRRIGMHIQALLSSCIKSLSILSCSRFVGLYILHDAFMGYESNIRFLGIRFLHSICLYLLTYKHTIRISIMIEINHNHILLFIIIRAPKGIFLITKRK